MTQVLQQLTGIASTGWLILFTSPFARKKTNDPKNDSQASVCFLLSKLIATKCYLLWHPCHAPSQQGSLPFHELTLCLHTGHVWPGQPIPTGDFNGSVTAEADKVASRRSKTNRPPTGREVIGHLRSGAVIAVFFNKYVYKFTLKLQSIKHTF